MSKIFKTNVLKQVYTIKNVVVKIALEMKIHS